MTRDLRLALRTPPTSTRTVDRPAIPCAWLQVAALEAIPELQAMLEVEENPSQRQALANELQAAIDLATNPPTWSSIDDAGRRKRSTG